MKSIFAICLFAFSTIMIVSCNKDDDSVENLAGAWRMTDIHSDDGVTVANGITSTVTYHGTEYNTITTFTENPNEFTSTGSYTFEITTTTLGFPFTQEVTVDAFAGTGTWSIENDVLTQDFGGTIQEFEILELTETTMRLKEDVDVTIGGVHNTATVFVTFERI